MADVVTMLKDLINPEVMGQMVSAKVEKKLRVLPYAKVDTTLQANAGDTITIPKYTYIGDAVDVAEGEEIPTRKMEVTAEQYKVKKIGIGGIITDEAALSGYGNPVGELNNNMALSISAKTDTDGIEELYKAKTAYVSEEIIAYAEVVNAIDLFEEEENSEKVMFVHPKQVTQLRLDPDFISREKYGNEVMVNGEIGMIANARIVPSKKVKSFDTWYTLDSSGALSIVESGGNNSTTVDLANVLPSLPSAKVGDKVTKKTTSVYFNPIVKIESDAETEDESPALTIFLKRDTNIETDRISRKRTTEVTGDKIYCVALTNDAKVVIAKLATTASV